MVITQRDKLTFLYTRYMDKEDLWVPVVTFTVYIPLCYVTKVLKQKYRSQHNYYYNIIKGNGKR